MASRMATNVAAFWFLGLLNNFLYVVMNAGASTINDSGIGLVYLAGIFPTLCVKLTGPYWFHYVSYKVRIWIAAVLMAACLFVVAWGETGKIKLLGVALASAQSGIGEASLLAMASFYDSQKCLTGWSSGTGFAGIFGYFWSILFSRWIGACFQVQLMVGLWIPVAWLVVFHCMLSEPWVDFKRHSMKKEPMIAADTDSETDLTADATAERDQTSRSDEDNNPVTDKLACADRFKFTLSLWPFMIPLFLVYSSEYIIQAGAWSSMGFPPSDVESRHAWYQWANFTYQVGVFISRTLGGMIVLNLSALWAGPILQLVFMVFFLVCAYIPWGGWWMILPALCVGFLGGFVYVQAFVLVSQKIEKRYVELALSTASVADTFGIITADIVAIIVQGCLFGHLKIMDTKPDFTCGYDIWKSLPEVAEAATSSSRICFPGVKG